MSGSYQEYKGKGLTGLCNLGNTCYVNSSLQCIGHVPELNEYIRFYFKQYNEHSPRNQNVLFLKEWIDLHTMMWSKNVIISPNRFIGVIHKMSQEKKNALFVGFEQNDSTEFLYFLLSIFHDALKTAPDVGKIKQMQLSDFLGQGIPGNSSFLTYFKKYHDNNYSIIDTLFGVYCKIDIIDKKTQKCLSSNYENFYILDIALHSTQLNECLHHHFQDELMNKENDNQYYDDKEKCYKDVVKKTSIYHFPKYLAIQLKRWNYNLRKNQRIIHYDLQSLDMNPFLHNERIEYEGNTTYQLMGIINHSGNVMGGHYFSYIKNFNGKWYCFNDTSVQEIPVSKLLSNKNYCLLYRRGKK